MKNVNNVMCTLGKHLLNIVKIIFQLAFSLLICYVMLELMLKNKDILAIPYIVLKQNKEITTYFLLIMYLIISFTLIICPLLKYASYFFKRLFPTKFGDVKPINISNEICAYALALLKNIIATVIIMVILCAITRKPDFLAAINHFCNDDRRHGAALVVCIVIVAVYALVLGIIEIFRLKRHKDDNIACNALSEQSHNSDNN